MRKEIRRDLVPSHDNATCYPHKLAKNVHLGERRAYLQSVIECLQNV